MFLFETLTLITYSTLLFIYFLALELYTRLWRVLCPLSGTNNETFNNSIPLVSKPRIPTELLERVADFLFEHQPAVDTFLNAKATSICSVKPAWKDVAGFMSASPPLHHASMIRWVQVLKIKHPRDWSIAARYSSYVREIICSEGVLVDSHGKRILTGLTRIYALSVDSHEDLERNGDQFAYRRVFSVIPSTIVRLEITHAHSPDVNVISTVKRYCPALEELRLGRCTMFNRTTACDFWKMFPLEHNSYMSDSGTEEYATALAQELASLRYLKVLQMGIYLVPSSVVLAHRLYHTRGLPAPAIINWELAIPLAQQPLDLQAENPVQVVPATTSALIDVLHQPDLDFKSGLPTCNFCLLEFSEANSSAEAVATRILKETVPSLEIVRWMNWFSHEHLGLSN